METESGWTGRAGEPVPVVDPVDIQLVWKAQQELEKRFPRSEFGLVAVAGGKSPCSEGADVAAVGYRTAFLNLMIPYSPEIAAHVKDGQLGESLCRAIAEIPMEWIGEKGREGLPFDEKEFILRLRGEQI
jgi:hypothetical protein